jgi:hypothetical protein
MRYFVRALDYERGRLKLSMKAAAADDAAAAAQ